MKYKVTYSRTYDIEKKKLITILQYLGQEITEENLEELAVDETINLMGEDMELFCDDVENFATIEVTKHE